MAIDETVAITKVVAEHLDKIALTDKTLAGFAVSEVVAPVPANNSRQITMGVAWLVTVTLPGLLGQPKVAKSTPVPGARPPDQLLKMATAQMLEECREERDRLNQTPLQMTLPFPAVEKT